MGTPDFAVPALKALHAAGHDIVGVYSQPPRAAGRGKKPRPGPVHKAAEELGFPVLTPVSLRKPEAQSEFSALSADVAVVAAYGLILPQAILDAPKFGCFNIHASLLPRWRGAAPIHRAIMAGDAKTGVTIMKMDAGLDTGDMALVEETDIGRRDTTAGLHDRLADVGAELMVEALAKLAAGTLNLTPQPEDGVTYAAKIDKAEAHIDWTQDDFSISAKVHGLTPFPGAWFEHAGERIKVHDVYPVMIEPASANLPKPGTIYTDDLIVTCGNGFLKLATLQRAGKRAMSAVEFQRGKPIPKGAKLA
jgi:methionyl-tRNA formyltransferase